MTTFYLDDLIEPVSREQVQASIYEVLATLGVNTTSWKPGNVVRTLIVGSSVVLAALSQLQARIARSGFLEYSEGEWLRLVAHFVYRVDKIEATFATGEITLTNTGGGVYAFDPGDLIFSNSATGKTYRTTAPVSLAALATANVAIRATEVGADSTSGPEEIDTLVTTVLGVTCSNAGQLTGTDAESDVALRQRCSEKLGSLSPFGPWDAYAFAARSATHADGTSLGINRIRITKDGYGTVTTYLAGASGAIPGEADDPETDLGIANAAIQRGAVPVGVTGVVVSATNHSIAITYEAWMYESTLTDEQVEGAITDALAAFMAAQPIGGNVIGANPGKIFVNAIRSAIFEALPEIIQVSVTLPAGDVTLDPNDVATLNGAPIATAIHREAQPEGFGGAING